MTGFDIGGYIYVDADGYYTQSLWNDINWLSKKNVIMSFIKSGTDFRWVGDTDPVLSKVRITFKPGLMFMMMPITFCFSSKGVGE